MSDPSRKKEELTDAEFEARLKDLVAGKPIKIWLAKSVLGRVDTIFSVGTAQGETIRNFDHLGGFYLLGEGVTTDLIHPIHQLFTQYCLSHRAFQRVKPAMRVVDVRYRERWFAEHKEGHDLVMHIPLSVGT